MNHHMIWIGWQQCKHVSRIRPFKQKHKVNWKWPIVSPHHFQCHGNSILTCGTGRSQAFFSFLELFTLIVLFWMNGEVQDGRLQKWREVANWKTPYLTVLYSKLGAIYQIQNCVDVLLQSKSWEEFGGVWCGTPQRSPRPIKRIARAWRPKGPGKRGHIVADTLLPTKMFPRLPATATFAADTNFVSGTQKMFLILFRNLLCTQQMFPSLRSPRNIMGNNVPATMCLCLPGP